MSGMNAEPNEYAENSKNAERFFLETSRGAFLFAVTNDEFVQQDFNKALRFRLLGRGKTIHIHDWQKDGEGLYPAEQLRSLQKKYPDTAGLILTGLDFSFLGEAEKARLLHEKAVEIKNLKSCRELERTNPQSHQTHIAGTLGKLAGLQVALNDFSAAGRGYREALEIYRELARSTSSTFLSDVAATLGNLAQVDAAQNDFTSAEKGYQEALSLYRELANTNPSTYLPYVAATLNNLAKIQSTMNESTAALQGYQEALKITGELASAVTWLHVSDFHLSDCAPYDQEVILRSLVESVKWFRQEGHAPDLIFATGDIAKNGKAREYEQATQFFDALLKAAGLGKERLFIVPGRQGSGQTAHFTPLTTGIR